jgi:hypothetical protein
LSQLSIFAKVVTAVNFCQKAVTAVNFCQGCHSCQFLPRLSQLSIFAKVVTAVNFCQGCHSCQFLPRLSQLSIFAKVVTAVNFCQGCHSCQFLPRLSQLSIFAKVVTVVNFCQELCGKSGNLYKGKAGKAGKAGKSVRQGIQAGKVIADMPASKTGKPARGHSVQSVTFGCLIWGKSVTMCPSQLRGQSVVFDHGTHPGSLF